MEASPYSKLEDVRIDGKVRSQPLVVVGISWCVL